MHHFKNLKIWQRGRNLVKEIYEITSDFPESEKFGLTSQIRRCAVSIPSNIAEGSGRGSDSDFGNFLNYSIGSSFELETQLILANDLKLISDEKFENLIQEINEMQRMLIGFKNKIVNEV